MTKLGSSGGDALDSAQAKVSSVVQEASSAVADVTSAIAKPTLVANMTAEKACLELLTFSDCRSTPIDGLFLAGFWILVLAATLTATTFFRCGWLKKIGRRVVRWLAIILGLLAILFFLSLTILCWTIHRTASLTSESEEESENAQAIYSCFTVIAFISVVAWVTIRLHKRRRTCDKCHDIGRNSLHPSKRMQIFIADSPVAPQTSVKPPPKHPEHSATRRGEPWSNHRVESQELPKSYAEKGKI